MTQERLNDFLAIPNISNIIVAFPDKMSLTDVFNIATTYGIQHSVENAVLPYLFTNSGNFIVFANSKKFESAEYKEEFLKKCQCIGEKVSLSVL